VDLDTPENEVMYMFNFKKLSDEDLKRWVWLYESCPSTKILCKKEIYELAVKEMKLRGLNK
jgi:hypothetical protein